MSVEIPHRSVPGALVRERGLLKAWTPFVAGVGLAGVVLGGVWAPAFLQGGMGWILLLLAAGVLIWSRFHALNVLQRYARGAEGEEWVAECLRGLSEAWTVLHGVPGLQEDLDHVLVGPSGIWLVETIRWRGRVDVRDDILWDGDEKYPGFTLAGLRARVENFRSEMEDPDLPVRLVVAVAGGRLGREKGEVGGVWLAEAEDLVCLVESVPQVEGAVEAAPGWVEALRRRYRND
jgi:hypothetical protein